MIEIDYLMKEIDYLTESLQLMGDAVYRQSLQITALERRVNALEPQPRVTWENS